MAAAPFFSIVTTTYRRPELLRRAIRSVVNQTFGNFEQIVVDDGGDEETAEVVESFRDARIVLIRHERNRGVAAARNSGIREARGEWLAFLDDDDEYLPRFLERTLESIWRSTPPVRFVWTNIRRVIDTPEGEVPAGITNWPERFRTREEAIVGATSIGIGYGVTIRRKVLDETGLYDETYPVCVDTEFLFRLAPRAASAVVPEVLVKIHQHGGEQLTDPSLSVLRLECHERLIRRHRDLVERMPMLASVHFKVLADLSYRTSQKTRGRAWIYQILRRNPFSIAVVRDWIAYELFGKDLPTLLRESGLGRLARRGKRLVMSRWREKYRP